MDVIAHYRRTVSKFVDWMEVSKCVCYVHISRAGHIRTVESSPLNQNCLRISTSGDRVMKFHPQLQG
jgi:hypothetical protein